MTSNTIAIVGGGFAGTSLAMALEKRLPPGWRALLISEESYTTFNPMLAEVVGAAVFPEHVIVPIREMLRQTRFVMGRLRARRRAAPQAQLLDAGRRTALRLRASGARLRATRQPRRHSRFERTRTAAQVRRRRDAHPQPGAATPGANRALRKPRRAPRARPFCRDRRWFLGRRGRRFACRFRAQRIALLPGRAAHRSRRHAVARHGPAAARAAGTAGRGGNALAAFARHRRTPGHAGEPHRRPLRRVARRRAAAQRNRDSHDRHASESAGRAARPGHHARAHRHPARRCTARPQPACGRWATARRRRMRPTVSSAHRPRSSRWRRRSSSPRTWSRTSRAGRRALSGMCPRA